MKLTVLIICIFVTSDVAVASQAWGVAGGNSTAISLYPINTATGTVSFSEVSESGGTLAFANIDDLASDPVRYPQLVWAVRTSIDGNELIAVDPYRESILSYAIIDASSDILGIAINPRSGVMFGTSTDALFTVDAFTGESNLVGETSLPDISGLGFDDTGRLFGIQGTQFVEIDIMDASITSIGTVSANQFSDIAADPQSRTLYGLGLNIYELVTIDPSSGTVTTVGESLIRPSGLAFTAVPEPSSWLMVIIAGLVMIMPWSRGICRSESENS